MVVDTLSATRSTRNGLPGAERLMWMLNTMMLIRHFEERVRVSHP